MNHHEPLAEDQLFHLQKPVEIRGLIYQLIDKRCIFSVRMDNTDKVLLTTILAVANDTQEMLLETSLEAGINAMAGDSSVLHFQTQMDGVEVRFRTGPPVLKEFGLLPAFSVPLPQQVWYLQQRAFFRLKIPSSAPVFCELLLPGDAGDLPVRLQAPVMDISVGGVALQLPITHADDFPVGATFDLCRIALQGSGDIRVRLQVCYVRPFTDTAGNLSIRTGCRFLDPGQTTQAVVQRYISGIDRQRITEDLEAIRNSRTPGITSYAQVLQRTSAS